MKKSSNKRILVKKNSLFGGTKKYWLKILSFCDTNEIAVQIYGFTKFSNYYFWRNIYFFWTWPIDWMGLVEFYRRFFWGMPAIYYSLIALGMIAVPVIGGVALPYAQPNNYSGSIMQLSHSIALIAFFCMGTPVALTLVKLFTSKSITLLTRTDFNEVSIFFSFYRF